MDRLPQISLSDLIIKSKHIFFGTNDFEHNLSLLQTSINKLSNISKSNSAYLVSGGWMFILFQLFKSHHIDSLVFFDLNPFMLPIYFFIKELIVLSSSRNDFVSRVFCRSMDNYNFTNNKQSIEFMNQPQDPSIFDDTIILFNSIHKNQQLQDIFKQTYIAYYIMTSNNPKQRQLYPAHFYCVNDQSDNYMDGKKLHTTQSKNDNSHFFTTFYYNVLAPFDSDKNFEFFKQQLSRNLPTKYVISDVQYLVSQNEFCLNTFVYIDGIDDKYCYYLGFQRDLLFKQISQEVKGEVIVISTKSGITQIKKGIIETDKNYPIEEYVKVQMKMNNNKNGKDNCELVKIVQQYEYVNVLVAALNMNDQTNGMQDIAK